MTTISSHILDSTCGTDAGGIQVSCYRLSGIADPALVFDLRANNEGRISSEIDTTVDLPNTLYELVFFSGAYFAHRQSTDKMSFVNEVVVRIDLSGAEKRFHVPLLIAPHNYTLWWSC